MADLPWEGSTALAEVDAASSVVLLADASGSYYASMTPDGTPLGGTGVAQLTGAMEASVKKGEIKLPSSKDLESFAGQGPLIVDPTTGEVRVGTKAEADSILKDAAKDWPMMVAQVENTLQSSYQAALNYVPAEGGVHPQGGYVAKSGSYYPPAPALMPKDSELTKAPDLFKKSTFAWRSIYHPFVNSVFDPIGDGSIVAEVCFTPTPMRMYTDHRVMGQVVLPGVSHISLAAAVASVGMEGTGFKRNEFSINVHETFFERPYLVNDGNEIIAMVASQQQGGQVNLQQIPGTEMTYCRVARVDKEYGGPAPVKI
mmetsp:Transcript_95596/g.175203  ORF Transcript_95596/g.175203 Transcript_95596/m.175203 type:complete len:314 (-) Transcript_95596:85-1026(-)